MSEARSNWSFTLRDLFALVTILSLLFAFVVPRVLESRERARAAQCVDRLRAIGVGMFRFANSDPNERLCTGATDHRFDGYVDEVGWVADQLGLQSVVPEQLLCPINPARGSATLSDMLADPNFDLRRRGSPSQSPAPWVSGSSDLGTPAKSELRARLVARRFVDRGFNTNYAASWLLARASPRFTSIQGRLVAMVTSQDLRDRRNGINTLRVPIVEASPVYANVIPLLGDGANSSQPLRQELSVSPQLPSGVADPFSSNDSRSQVLLAQGTALAQTINGGPAFWDPVNDRLAHLYDGADLVQQIVSEQTGVSRPAIAGNDGYLQDTRAWNAVHETRNGAECNILMADGSVRSFCDLNGDRLLNPGFPIPVGSNGEQAQETGYTDATVEFPPAQMFSGVFIVKITKSSNCGE